jgi:sulfate transport system ATP-binding protein
MSISLSHLTKRYGKDAVVDDVTVEIPESSLTAVLGPSGSGKSTLLKLIAGLEIPDEGRVVIEGDDVTDVDPRHRDIGFCFQHYAPFRHMNVARNIGFGLRVRKQPKDVIDTKVAELIELVRLDGKAKSYPAQLSGGQRQRMALARALAIEPRVLLLDEPFGALDPGVTADMHELILKLWNMNKMTIVMVTHDLKESFYLGTRLLVFDKVRVDSQSPDRFGATITYNIPLRGHKSIQTPEAAPILDETKDGGQNLVNEPTSS